MQRTRDTVGIFPRIFIQSLLLKNSFGADDNMGANTETLEILFIFSGGFILKINHLLHACII